MIIECNLSFESAHRNTSANASERTSRLHGHSYEATVVIKGAIDPRIGWVMDFAEVKDRASEVIDRLDHRILNDIEGMTDTTREDVERWLTRTIRTVLPALHECRLTIPGDRNWPPIVARPGSGGEKLRFGFDSAHFLPTVPDAHKCRRTHGHSFRVAVTTANAARMAEPIREIYEILDHRLLNDIAGLHNPTSELLAHWLADGLKRRKCLFDEIMVAETCTSSCHLNMK